MTSDKNDAYVNDIPYQRDDSCDLKNEKSNIADFFAHTNVLVTGGTGFLGKLLIEKLLRCCPDMKTLYMVVRPKKGKSSQERFKEHFEDAPYERLRKEDPNLMRKVIMIEGDATQEDFGLSPESKKILMNTNVIFHAAATVRFDENLRVAVNINVKSTKYLLLFAKQLTNLKAFVHVSTAFSNCTQECINEIHYPPPMDGDKLITLLDTLDDERIEKLGPILLGNTPNTYIFTKAIGENIVLKYSDEIPACIVRPSIVISTSKEPITGWTNNLYGATGITIGAAVGLLRTVHCIEEKAAEVIPADYVIANIVAAAWDVGSRFKKLDKSANISDNERIPIYNSVSSCQNRITWGTYMHQNEVHGLEVPSLHLLWYYLLILNRYLFMHHICVFFLHLIPAAIVDTLAYLSGRKPMLLNGYKKIAKFSNVIHYFSTQEWQFSNKNVMDLWQKCNARDQEIFNFNIANLDWEGYFYNHVRGLRVYMLKDPLDTIEESKVRYQRLKWAHYTLVTTVSLLLLWMVVSFVLFLWSFCPLSH